MTLPLITFNTFCNDNIKPVFTFSTNEQKCAHDGSFLDSVRVVTFDALRSMWVLYKYIYYGFIYVGNLLQRIEPLWQT